jgi:hypothetical protein
MYGPLTFGQSFGGAEITELDEVALGVYEYVAGLDVSVADADSVDVGETPEHLVGVELD